MFLRGAICVIIVVCRSDVCLMAVISSGPDKGEFGC